MLPQTPDDIRALYQAWHLRSVPLTHPQHATITQAKAQAELARRELRDLVIETAGLTTPEVGALSDALKAFRRRRDLAAEFLIVNSTGGEFVPRVPSGWPPS